MNKQQLANKIWESANKMRSKIEANEYKDYILGFIFYKYLSDQEVRYLKKEDWEEEDYYDWNVNIEIKLPFDGQTYTCYSGGGHCYKEEFEMYKEQIETHPKEQSNEEREL